MHGVETHAAPIHGMGANAVGLLASRRTKGGHAAAGCDLADMQARCLPLRGSREMPYS